MSSQRQEVSKVSEEKEQPCPSKIEVIPVIGAHQTKLGTFTMVGYGETNAKHSHQELGLSGVIHTGTLQMSLPETRGMNWGIITVDHWETTSKVDGRRVCKFLLSFFSWCAIY